MREGLSMFERLAETRSAARYPAVCSEVYLGWWEESQFRTRAAALKNVSHGGALVNVALPSPGSSGLWLSMGGTPPTEWTGVSVVTETNPQAGLFQVRLRFVDGCPYDVYKKAVHGIGGNDLDD
jgi:hypothetical protein